MKRFVTILALMAFGLAVGGSAFAVTQKTGLSGWPSMKTRP